MEEQMTVTQALSAAMRCIGAVGKSDQNRSQGWSFRGVDAVVNAVSPALRKHGIVVLPNVLSHDVQTISTSGGKAMQSVRVRVAYVFYGPAGDSVEACSVGEAFDSGDKATAKAMSVALRTCLLQSLMLPTDEQDPDHEVYQVEVPFDGAVQSTWPETLSSRQAKDVLMAHTAGDRVSAATIWQAELAELDEYPADLMSKWAVA